MAIGNKIKFLLRLGLSVQDIASKLSVSEATVYKYRRIYYLEESKKQAGQVLYHTQEYSKWRNLVLERDGRVCVRCGSSGSRYNPLQADHILPKSRYPHLALVVSNGRTLCKKCHKKTKTWGRQKSTKK